jgi:hypothetical protein
MLIYLLLLLARARYGCFLGLLLLISSTLLLLLPTLRQLLPARVLHLAISGIGVPSLALLPLPLLLLLPGCLAGHCVAANTQLVLACCGGLAVTRVI